jgi:hypothetical protein
MPDAILAHHSNRKGCGFGYAPSANSCEGANNVDACTVTALDAITAFAVPSPNGRLAAPSVFSGLEVQRVAPPNPSPSLLQASYFYVASPFLPSTGAILIQQFQLSTPKIGANAISFHARVALPK